MPSTEPIVLTRPPFLWTLDQIADLIQVQMASFYRWVYYEGVDAGGRKPDLLTAHNIAPLGEKEEWRVSEDEVARWLRRRGFRMGRYQWL
jgi:hypothetical protein